MGPDKKQNAMHGNLRGPGVLLRSLTAKAEANVLHHQAGRDDLQHQQKSDKCKPQSKPQHLRRHK